MGTKGRHLGEFEEIVLLSVLALHGEAYGLAIKKDIATQTGRSVTISAVHATCNRLETKGLLASSLGAPTAKRGGKRKKIYAVTMNGQRALHASYVLRSRLWDRIAGRLQIDLAGGRS
ncbi:MAG: PadR family transcriptional regulator [Bacteroidota bacterium]